jgi:septum formation protein
MDRPPLILASASPRRLALLAQIGVVPDAVVAPEVDEAPLKRESPRALALRLAEAKARAVMAVHSPPAERGGLGGGSSAVAPDPPPTPPFSRGGRYVLAADTVVARGRRVLDKPADAQEARAHLALLSGRRHRVYGGIALARPDGRVITRAVDTVVRFKRLSDAEIERYIQSGEWRGAAGAYAIQGRAGAFVAALNGSPTNVVGLCVHTVAKMLGGAGYARDNA